MIKDIAVILDDTGQKASPYALSLASHFDGFVTALSVAPEESFETFAYADVRYDTLIQSREETRERAAAIAARFAEAARSAAVAAETSIVCDRALECERAVVDFARLTDLVIIEQREPNRPKPADFHIEPLLMESGRPVIVVPYIHDKPAKFDVVTLAWDGSVTSARAMAAAVPLMQSAHAVEIVTVAKSANQSDGDTHTRIVTHLARHGIEARARTIVSSGSVTEILLSTVSDSGSDLLVMGAYGHSRLREAFLGGASRGILDAMIVPVLMSH